MTATTQLDVGKALGTDYLLLRSELSQEETDYLDRTRRFVGSRSCPGIGSAPSCRSTWRAGSESSDWWAMESRVTDVRR